MPTGGALVGFNFADAAAAIVVGAMIVKAGVGFAWEAIRELIDTGLSAEEVAAIRESIAATPGVKGLHELRTRRMAHQVLVDAHVQVDPRISVSEGHRVAETARQNVLERHDDVLDVLVHVDAENDLMGTAAARLPDREDLLARLRELLGPDFPAVERTTLHYLGNRVEAEFVLTALTIDASTKADLDRRIASALAEDGRFASIVIHQRIAP